jgi:hypothetical protein
MNFKKLSFLEGATVLVILFVLVFLFTECFAADKAVVWDSTNRTYRTYGINTTGIPKITSGNQSVNATQDDLANGTIYKQYNPADVNITGGHINATVIDSGILAPARLGTGASNTTFFRGDGTFQPVSSAGYSNVLWEFYGSSESVQGRGFYTGTSTPTSTTAGLKSMWFYYTDATYHTFIAAKFTKTGGVNTITSLINASYVGNDVYYFKTVVGGVDSNEISITGNNPAFAWLDAMTIDVSSLADGTTYDVYIQGRARAGQGSLVGIIADAVGFGS